jgi:hypothetical protein
MSCVLQSLLDDKDAEVIGENFMAVSPAPGIPEPDFVDVPVPAQATVLLATHAQVPPLRLSGVCEGQDHWRCLLPLPR